MTIHTEVKRTASAGLLDPEQVRAPGDSGFGADGDHGIALDRSGSPYLTGETYSTDFPVTKGAFQTGNKASEFGDSAFVTRFVNFAARTSTGLSSDGNPQTVKVKITFTAYVASVEGNGIPTGTVSFSVDGGTAVELLLDDTGHASYATSPLAVGTYTIVASYSGDTHYAASTSRLTEKINAASTIASLK